MTHGARLVEFLTVFFLFPSPELPIFIVDCSAYFLWSGSRGE